jgi:uncharacterized protein (TIGR02145 family)
MKTQAARFTLNFLMLFFFSWFQELSAQDYLISFSGTGASTTITSIKVENITQGTSTTVDQGNSLRLQSLITGTETPIEDKTNRLIVFPNPMKDCSVFSFNLTEPDETTIELYDISGKLLNSKKYALVAGNHSFKIDYLNKGLYLLSVRTRNFVQTSKILSTWQSGGNQGNLCHFSEINIHGITKSNIALSPKNITSEVKMQYNTGDRIKYTGISGNYSTVLTDIPTGNESLVFNFIQCSDGDGNNYPIVSIGTQVWMAENLQTTKFNDGNSVPPITSSYDWSNLTTSGYCWYNNDATTYKPIYGALYNWYSVNTGKLCPSGWHVPDDAEWNILGYFLRDNGFNYDGTNTGYKYAKALASASGWTSSLTTGGVGNYDYSAKKNATGFTGLPGGLRDKDGLFIYIRYFCNWWSATEYTATYARYHFLSYDLVAAFTDNNPKKYGYSIRCILDY